MTCQTPNCKNEVKAHPTAKYCKECALIRKKEATKRFNKKKSENLRLAFGFKYV